MLNQGLRRNGLSHPTEDPRRAQAHSGHAESAWARALHRAWAVSTPSQYPNRAAVLRGKEGGELVERCAPSGLGVAASRCRVGAVAKRHACLVAVVVELYAQQSAVGHAGFRYRVGAHDEQLGFYELDDLVSERHLAAAF